MKNIYVQDNFLELEIFQKVQNEVMSTELSARYKDHSENIYQRNYHYTELDPNVILCKIIKKNIKKYFGFNNIKDMVTNYFLSFPNTPAIPHKDNNFEYNCMIYVVGETIMNNGTGFYELDGDNAILHTHIGFKPNRAVFFDSTIIHSPLQFAGNSTPRYLITNFINAKDE